MPSYEVEIQRPAKKCFAAFCAAEDLPSWVPGLLTAEAVSKDRSGRPFEVRFTAQLADGLEAQYTLLYTYEKLKVSWYSGSDGAYASRGHAVFEAPTRKTCRLVYSLDLGPGRALYAEEVQAAAIATLDAFRAWVER